MVGDDLVFDRVFPVDRRFVTGRNVRFETRDRRAQRQRPPVGEHQRLEEDVDETVHVADVGRGGCDDANLFRAPAGATTRPPTDERIFQMRAATICPACDDFDEIALVEHENEI